MAIQRRTSFLSQQRVDVPAMRSIESATSNDFDQLFQAFVTGSTGVGQSNGNPGIGYILRGFNIEMAGAIGGAANNLQLSVDPAALLHIAASQSGTVFMVPPGTPNQQLNSSTNTNVTGGFTPNAINFVGIDYIRFLDPTTDAQSYFWDPTSNSETTMVVPQAEILTYTINVSTAPWPANMLPIATVTTDAGNNVTSITDARWLLFRLGTGGASPNPFFVYPWADGRVEDPSTSTSNSIDPFYGGDKQLLTLKDWMNAIMSALEEIKGTTYWYSDISSSGSLTNLREDVANTVVTGDTTISNGILPNSTPVLTTTGNISSAYVFTLSSAASITSGTVYSNNGQTFTVLTTTTSSTTLSCSGTGMPQTTGTLTFVSGSPSGDLTFSSVATPNQLTSLASTTGIATGQFIIGSGILSGTTVLSIIGSTVTMSQNATATTTGVSVSFYTPEQITAPGQINWASNPPGDGQIYFKLIGSQLSYQIAENPTGSTVTLTDDKVAYITLTRNSPVTPNLFFTANSGPDTTTVRSIGAIPWTTGLLAGDFIRAAADSDANYYPIYSVDSPTQVTLTGQYTPAGQTATGVYAVYAYGSYTLPGETGGPRDMVIADRASVPMNANVIWLFYCAYDGGSVNRVYVKFMGAELQNGDAIELSGPQLNNVLQYIGSPVESATAPNYTATVSPGAVPQITSITVGAASTMVSDQYFYIYSAGTSRSYYVWANIDGTGVDPKPQANYIGIPWIISSGQTDAEVAADLTTALNGITPNDFSASAASAVVTVTNKSAGVTTSATNIDIGTPFAISITQSGTGIGNFIVNDGDNLTLAIKKLDEAIGNLEASLNNPNYDENISIVASGGATPPYAGSGYPDYNPVLLNGPIAANTQITLPENSRESNIQAFYTVGKGTLELYLNGQYLELGVDWLEVGTLGAASDVVEILQSLVVGDTLEFRTSGGGAGGGGGIGPPGPAGPAGPAGADAIGGPVTIMTYTSSTTVTQNVSLGDATSGPLTFTLPSASSATGRIFWFKKVDATSNAVTIMAAGSDLIDGVSFFSFTIQYQSFMLVTNGIAWSIF